MQLLNGHIDTYLKAKENGGQSFPDFTGALALDDLAGCVELSAVYRAKRQAEDEARRARAAEEEKAYCAEQNRLAEQDVAAALQIIRSGGVLQNTTIKFYDDRCSARSYSIVNYLMRRYHIDVPLRTQGWINSKLSSAEIRGGRCESLRFFRAKNCHGSQKFFEYMNALIRAVAEAGPDTAVLEAQTA